MRLWAKTEDLDLVHGTHTQRKDGKTFTLRENFNVSGDRICCRQTNIIGKMFVSNPLHFHCYPTLFVVSCEYECMICQLRERPSISSLSHLIVGYRDGPSSLMRFRKTMHRLCLFVSFNTHQISSGSFDRLLRKIN